MPELQCIVVTPERTVRETAADFVAVTLFDGELGIAPGHTPLIGRLGYGEMRIRRGDETSRLYIEDGFVEVVDNVVSVLTARAILPEDIDEAVVSERLAAAQSRRATSPEEVAVRERSVAQGRAQLRVSRHA